MTLRFTLELYHRVVWKLGSLVDCLPLKHAVKAAVPSGSPKRKQAYCDFEVDFFRAGYCAGLPQGCLPALARGDQHLRLSASLSKAGKQGLGQR
jgi:hypothetical protein